MDPKIDRNVFRDLSYGLYIVACGTKAVQRQVVNTSFRSLRSAAGGGHHQQE